jgi:hypothetical protein
MKIDRIQAKSFGCYEALDLRLEEKLSLFLGPSGAGKSTIRAILEAGLLGTARGLARGDAAALGANWGADGWGLKLSFTHAAVAHELKRTRTTQSMKQGAIEAATGPKKLLQGLLHLAPAKLAQADLRKLIFDMAGIEITDEVLEARGLETPEIRERVLSTSWRAGEARAKELRLEAQAELDGLDLAEIALVAVEDPGVEFQGKTKTCAELLEGGHYDRMRAWVGEAEEKKRDLRARLERAKGQDEGRRAELEKQIGEAEAELAGLDEADLKAQKEALTQKEREAQDLESACQEDLKNLRAQLEVADDEWAKAGRDLRRIDRAGETHACPDCGVEHATPTAAALGLPNATDQAKLVAAAEEVKGSLETRIAEGEATERQAKADAERFAEEARGIASRLKNAERLRKGVAERQAQIEALLEDPAGDRAEAEKALADLVPRLEAAQRVVDATQAYAEERDQAQKDYEEALRAHETRRERAGALTSQVEAYGRQERTCRPDGAISDILRESDRARVIHERLARWNSTGLLPLPVVLTADCEFMVKAGEAHLVPLSMLSKSEEWRANLFLADAIAPLAGLRWLCLDDVEQLDAARQYDLKRLLWEVIDDYDQILWFGVWSPDERPRQAKAGSGARVYWVEGGEVAPVPAQEGGAA